MVIITPIIWARHRNYLSSCTIIVLPTLSTHRRTGSISSILLDKVVYGTAADLGIFAHHLSTIGTAYRFIGVLFAVTLTMLSTSSLVYQS